MITLEVISHPDNLGLVQYVIRMTYEGTLSCPDDIKKFDSEVI